MTILNHFPFETPRKSQVAVIRAIEKAIRGGATTILLQGPVGSGKSAIAMTVAKHLGNSHILTPRKSLQDQYLEDFGDDVRLMKGRNAYPCVPRLDELVNTHNGSNATDDNRSLHKQIISDIEVGKLLPIYQYDEELDSCSTGPCTSLKNTRKLIERCTLEGARPCPYSAAIDVAQDSAHVVHNLHSFLYQANFSEKFEQRDLLVIDECHELEGVTRDFLTRSIGISVLTEPEVKRLPPAGVSVISWLNWFLEYKGIPPYSERKGVFKTFDSEEDIDTPISNYAARVLNSRGVLRSKNNKESTEEKFIRRLSSLEASKWDSGDFVSSYEIHSEGGTAKISFTPVSLGGVPEAFFLDYGKVRLLMSGTIYNKFTFCRNVGLDPDKVVFLNVPSEFPTKSMPVILDPSLMTDNSYKGLQEEGTYPALMKNINSVLSRHSLEKGLLHAPSYYEAQRISKQVVGPHRIWAHTPQNFQEQLHAFYADPEPGIFVSPTCQQGVDFKYDRARFQIVVRLPYPNASDAFNSFMMRRNFAWYSYQALVTLGQMTGRVMRAPDDAGTTYILDSRVPMFFKRNSTYLPKWFKDSICTDKKWYK